MTYGRGENGRWGKWGKKGIGEWGEWSKGRMGEGWKWGGDNGGGMEIGIGEEINANISPIFYKLS